MLPQIEKLESKSEVEVSGKIEQDNTVLEKEAEKPNSARSSLVRLNDDSDEFFDVACDVTDYDHLENGWFTEASGEMQNLVLPNH